MIHRASPAWFAWFLGGLVVAAPAATPVAAQAPLLERLEQRLVEAAARAPRNAMSQGIVSPIVRALASFEPGYLGVVTHESGGRVLVSSVRPSSPAERAGLRAGDELIAVNGRRVESVDEFAAAVEPFPPGAKLTFEIRRGGRRERVVAVLEDRDSGRVTPPREAQTATFLVERPTIGIRVGIVNDAARRAYGLTTKRGALIGEVTPDSPATRAGLSVGMVIVAVDGRRIDTPQDLSQLIRGARVGQELELTYYEGEQLRRKRIRVASSEPTLDAPEEVDALRTPDPSLEDPLAAEDVATPAPRLVERAPAGGAPSEKTPAGGGLLNRVPAERGQALKKLERAIEGFSRPPATGATPTDAGPPRDTLEAHLRIEIEALRAEVALLRQRVADLERRSDTRPLKPAAEPRAEAAEGDDPNDDRPKLEEVPPRPKPAPPQPGPPQPAPAVEPELKLGAPKLDAPKVNPPKTEVPQVDDPLESPK